jgi:NTP pyrophosphatase (non-canonical NTP hydrolase)
MSYPDQNDTLNEFHRLNRERAAKAFKPEHSLAGLVMCVQEEVGELAAAVLGVTGEKARKAHLTNDDVLDAVADAITYLSLVASKVGCNDLEALLGKTFNMVSKRAKSDITTTLGQR